MDDQVIELIKIKIELTLLDLMIGIYDKSNIGEIETTYLVNAWNDLEQADFLVEFRLSLQRRVDTVEVASFGKKFVAFDVPGNVASVSFNDFTVEWRNETFFRFLVIASIRERHRLPSLADDRERMLGWWFALGVEMLVD